MTNHYFSLILVFFSVGCAAGQSVIVMQGRAAGTYYYEITVRADGTIVAREIQNVVPIGGGQPGPNPPPDPNPPPQPPPDPPAPTLADFVLAEARKVNDTDRAKTAKAIAMIYSSIAALADANRISSVQQIRVGTDSLYNVALSETGKKNAWAQWKQAVDARTRNVNSVREMADAWRQIVTGLRRVEQTR